jgi:hypothetical protein
MTYVEAVKTTAWQLLTNWRFVPAKALAGDMYRLFLMLISPLLLPVSPLIALLLLHVIRRQERLRKQHEQAAADRHNDTFTAA